MRRHCLTRFFNRARAACGVAGAIWIGLGPLSEPSWAKDVQYVASDSILAPHPEAGEFLTLQQGLDDIAVRLAMAAEGQCANRWRHPGFKTHKLKDYPRSMRRSLRQFAHSEPQILSVSNPALHGLLRAGDQVIGANGRQLDDNSQALQIQLALGRVNLLRDGREITVSSVWPQLCYRPVRLTTSMQVEARTTPNAVEVSQGLINYVRSEDELAYAIAHELSHFMLDHSRRLAEARNEARLSPSLRRKLEIDADRGAVFLMHRAGYDVRGALAFIDRSSLLRDFPLLGLSSHPRRSDRLSVVETAIEDVFRSQGSILSVADFVGQ